MIRFRPHRRTISSSMKDEETFETVEEMLQYIFDHWTRIFHYVGSDFHLTLEDIVFTEAMSISTIDLTNTHSVTIRRSEPICIGFFGE